MNNKVKVFIINGLPNSGKHTFVNHISRYKNNTKYIDAKFPLDYVADKMWIDKFADDYNKFRVDLERLWNRYGGKYHEQFIRYLVEEIEARKEYKIASVIFTEVNASTYIDLTKMAIKTLGVECKTILIKRDGIPYPDELKHYALDKRYDIIINNNSSLKQLKRKATNFRHEFINKNYNKNGTIIF